jgi:hypothetical protein
MKKIILLLTLYISITGCVFSQAQATPKFVLTKDGVKPVVLNFSSTLSSNEIYKKVKEWVNLTYKMPKSAIRIDNENALVKVGGIKTKAWKIRTNNFDYWYDLEYTLTIDIKEAKCRVTFGTDDVRWKVWFNPDGTTVKKFKDTKATFETSINEFLTSLNNQIKGQKKVTKDDW